MLWLYLFLTAVSGQPYLYLDRSVSVPGALVNQMLRAWMEQADKLENGEISKKEYDEWRYKYPELNIYQRHAKVPSQKLSDYLVQALFDKKKKEKKNLTDIQFFTSESQ